MEKEGGGGYRLTEKQTDRIKHTERGRKRERKRDRDRDGVTERARDRGGED